MRRSGGRFAWRDLGRLRGRRHRKITNLDKSKDMITLDNGSSYRTPEGMKLSNFKVGEKVTVSYEKAGDMMDATSIKPAT
jgi:hypothetical protein